MSTRPLKDMAEAIIDYLAYLKTERGLAASTIENYRRDLEGLRQVLIAQGFQSLEELDSEALHQALLEATREALPRTLARKTSALRGFLKYREMAGAPLDADRDNLSTPKIGRVLPTVLTVSEVETLLQAAAGNKPADLRDRAILEMLYATGMRVSELTALRFSQVFAEEGYLRIIGKGNKERIVPLGEEAHWALDRYLREGRPKQVRGRNPELVFLNNRGTGLSRQTVWRIIKKYAEQAGIAEDRTLSPHVLRHSFATHLLAGGAHLRFIQEVLGHADIATTEIYTHVMNETMLTTFHQKHPRSEKGEPL